VDTSEALQRWDGFLAKIRQRVEETLQQAEQGCTALLDLANLDPLPMSNAWSAIEGQLLELSAKVQETWQAKVEPALEAAEWETARILEQHEKGAALQRWRERATETVSIRIFGDASRRIAEEARKNLSAEFRCTQCRAALEVSDRFFRSVHVTCPYCNNVNTFVPGTKVQAVEHFCCHHLAREKSRDLWFAWQDAEAAMRATNFESLREMKAAEAALLGYTRAYLRARIEVVPAYEPDFEKDLKGKTAFFYDEVSSSDVWTSRKDV
jgi:hypothetical protein